MTIFTAKSQPRYSNLRRKRRLRKITNVNIPQVPGSKNIFFGVLAFVAIILIIFLGLKLLSSDYFNVDTIDTLGVRSVTSEQIVEEVSEFTTQGIFFTSASSIEKTLLSKYPSFKLVSVKKIWPNKLIVNVTEKQTLFFYVNLNGIYLVNEDGVISEVIHQEKINFSEEQLGVITGEEGVNSTLVTKRLESEFRLKQEEEREKGGEIIPTVTEEEEEEFDISQVPLEDKFEMLNIIRQQLLDHADKLVRSMEESVDLATYPSLEMIYSFDNILYEESDQVDQNRLRLTNEMLKFSQQKSIEIDEIRWEGRYIVKFKTVDEKFITLGTGRNISEQLEDYLVVTTELKGEGKNYHEIDLSSRKVSVK